MGSAPQSCRPWPAMPGAARRHRCCRPTRPVAHCPLSRSLFPSQCCRPVLRLVCKGFKSLVDGVLSTKFKIGGASHLGGRLSSKCIYSSQLEFTAAAARVMKQRAGGRQFLSEASAPPGLLLGCARQAH